MTPTFAPGDRVRTTLDLVTPRASGQREPFAGKVISIIAGGEVHVEVTHPIGWAGQTIDFTADLLEHVD